MENLIVKIKNVKRSVSSYEEASALFQAYCIVNDLGASKICKVLLYNSLNIAIACVSYNGRVWKGTELTNNGIEIPIDGQTTNRFLNHFLNTL